MVIFHSYVKLPEGNQFWDSSQESIGFSQRYWSIGFDTAKVEHIQIELLRFNWNTYGGWISDFFPEMVQPKCPTLLWDLNE